MEPQNDSGRKSAGVAAASLAALPVANITTYATIKFFYAWGNTPPTYLRQHIPTGQARADVLMLGFADARDLFWTIACEDCQSTGPRALHVTLVDHEAGCLSRLLMVMDLFLELQPHSSFDTPPQPGEWGNLESPPHSSEAVPEWVTTIWSLLFNHFITYGQREVLRACARRLLVAMETPETWAQSRMGQIVTWMTEETVGAVRELLVKYAESPVIEREAFRKARRKVLEKTPVGKYSKKGRFSKLPVIYRGPAACMMETLSTHEDYGTALCDYLTTGNIDV